MLVNDPLGDMLTRIRNAQLRRRPKVSTPASKLRGRVLDVLESEGFIRGYMRVEQKGEHPEFEIELKYFNGQPAIKEIKRVSTPGRRVYSPVKELPTVANGLGVCDPVDPARRDVGRAGPRGERRRRDPLQRILNGGTRQNGAGAMERVMSRIGKRASRAAIRPHRDRWTGRQSIVKGSKGELSFTVPEDCSVEQSADGIVVKPNR